MGKCGLFAFGANESSACMCLYQNVPDAVRSVSSRAPSPLQRRKRRNAHSRDPRGFFFFDNPSVVCGYDLDFYVLDTSSPIHSC